MVRGGPRLESGVGSPMAAARRDDRVFKSDATGNLVQLDRDPLLWLWAMILGISRPEESVLGGIMLLVSTCTLE